jgi:hypothetical protein
LGRFFLSTPPQIPKQFPNNSQTIPKQFPHLYINLLIISIR